MASAAVENVPLLYRLLNLILQTREWGLPLGTFAFLPLLNILHAARICAGLVQATAFRSQTSAHYWAATMVLALGGGTVVSVAMGRPPEWLFRNETITIYSGMAWLLASSPTLQSFFTTPVMIAVTAAADGVLRGFSSAKLAVDPILQKTAPDATFPLVPCILAGVVASVGGGIVDNIFCVSRASWRIMPLSPTSVRSPDATLALISTSIYALLKATNTAKPETALAISCWLNAVFLAIMALAHSNAARSLRSSGGSRSKRDAPLRTRSARIAEAADPQRSSKSSPGIMQSPYSAHGDHEFVRGESSGADPEEDASYVTEEPPSVRRTRPASLRRRGQASSEPTDDTASRSMRVLRSRAL